MGFQMMKMKLMEPLQAVHLMRMMEWVKDTVDEERFCGQFENFEQEVVVFVSEICV